MICAGIQHSNGHRIKDDTHSGKEKPYKILRTSSLRTVKTETKTKERVMKSQEEKSKTGPLTGFK